MPFRKRYKSQFTIQIYEIAATVTKKLPTYTIKDDQGEFVHGKFYRRMQKFETHLANEGAGTAIFSMDLSHKFANNVDNDYGVLLRKKGPHKPESAYDIVGIQFLKMY